MACPWCGETCNCVPDVTSPPSVLNDVPSVNTVEGRSMQAVSGFDLRPLSQVVRATKEAQPSESMRPKFVVSPDEETWGLAENKRLEQSLTNEPVEELGLPAPDQDDSAHEQSSCETSLSESVSQPELDSWRDEVSARLSRYRARRRPRAPRYPSLRLKFEAPPPRIASAGSTADATADSALSVSAPLTCQALAMSATEPLEAPEATEVVTRQMVIEPAPVPVEADAPPVFGKILEFPRWAYGPPATANELADPVMDRPRILEVPEVVPPPPAMGGITIEDSRSIEPERQPGIDMPLRTAPLGLRIWAVVVDATLVLFATALFGAVFYRLTATRPPLWELIVLGAGLPCVLWAAYQYLFLVYCGSTLGLRAAHLRMSRFDGSPVNRRTRRLRVLCGFLSGFSLGMGYAWQFLDEDRLCWHERVTRTYLAPPA